MLWVPGKPVKVRFTSRKDRKKGLRRVPKGSGAMLRLRATVRQHNSRDHSRKIRPEICFPTATITLY